MRAWIVVLHWNNFTDTHRCLERILAQEADVSGLDFSPVVVDNGSTDDSAERLAKRHPGVPLVQTEQNLGFAAGVNTGLRYVLTRCGTSDRVLILNNDAIIGADAISALSDVLGEDSIGLTSCLVLYSDGRVWYGGGHLSSLFGAARIHSIRREPSREALTPRDVGFVSLAVAMTRADVLTSLGLLDERFFFGQEEWDFSHRLRAYGYRLWYEPRVLCYHEGDGSHSNANPGFVYNGLRNRYIYQSTWLPPRHYAVWRLAFLIYSLFLMPIRVSARYPRLSRTDMARLAFKAFRDAGQGHAVTSEDLEAVAAEFGAEMSLS